MSSVFAQRVEIHMASSPHPSAICHQIADSLLGPASVDEENLLSDELHEPARSSFFFFWRHTILKNYRDMDVRSQQDKPRLSKIRTSMRQ